MKFVKRNFLSFVVIAVMAVAIWYPSENTSVVKIVTDIKIDEKHIKRMQGTGVVIHSSEKGTYILTNAHVLHEEKFGVEFEDGLLARGEVLLSIDKRKKIANGEISLRDYAVIRTTPGKNYKVPDFSWQIPPKDGEIKIRVFAPYDEPKNVYGDLTERIGYIDGIIIGGNSGGPIIYDGIVIGIVQGHNLEDLSVTYWQPLVIMKQDFLDNGLGWLMEETNEKGK